MLIDAHHHLWQYNDRDYAWMSEPLRALRRDFLVQDLEQAARGCGLDGTVAVQARQTLEETDWLLGIAANSSLVQGVVGWLPLYDPSIASLLETYADRLLLKGLRHVLQDEPDERYMLRDDFNRGVALLAQHGLVYDILIYERHLPQAIEFVDRHPQQIFVLDHLAKPRIKDGVLSPWREQMQELARRENVYCKVSGMVTEADWEAWTADQLQPYFDTALECFGPERLMFGSDWPVLTLGSSYARWLENFHSWIATLSPHEQERISSGTAREAYRL